MARYPRGPAPRRLSLWALVLYIAGWTGVAAMVVVLATALVDDGEEQVTLPPVQETRLTIAAAKGGCMLRSGADLEGSGGRATAARAPAKPGVYERAIRPAGAIVAARRRGIIVIEYSPSISERQVEQLRKIQSAVPRGTIVAPDRRLDFVVVATAWRRRLACARLQDDTFDAIRLFRGRYIGSGPEAG